jgi:uncharacterized phage-associated protein
MGIVTAEKVADYILCYFHDRGDDISHLKLQKLVYYAQGWFLGYYSEPLFDDRIEAWVRGPVQPELYQKFKGFDYHPITLEADCRDFEDSRTKRLLDYVLDRYGSYTAWIGARNGLSPNENGSEVITIGSMKEYFEKEIEREELEEKKAMIMMSEICFQKALNEES